MARMFILAALLLCTGCSDEDSVKVSKVVSVYDADTFKANIEGWPAVVGEAMPIRVAGIDAPEIRGKCESEKRRAREARDFARALLISAEDVELKNIERGKYFRLVADVYIDGESLAEKLVASGQAVAYQGGARGEWCD